MVTLLDLWLPILLSGVAVFFASFLIWAVLPFHRGDHKRLPGEEAVIAAMRQHGVKGGMYAFPYATSMDAFKDETYKREFEQGPSGFLTVRPSGPFNMGPTMLISFVYNVVIALIVAYLATIGLAAGAASEDVFRFTATAAFLGFAGALPWEPIWFAKSWNVTIRSIIDGLVYGAATGAVFTWLWPGTA